MKTVIHTTGQNMLLEVDFASANKIFSSEFPKISKWILANVEDYDRVFRPLISGEFEWRIYLCSRIHGRCRAIQLRGRKKEFVSSSVLYEPGPYLVY